MIDKYFFDGNVWLYMLFFAVIPEIIVILPANTEYKYEKISDFIFVLRLIHGCPDEFCPKGILLF
jgi:hypothetical protein